MNEKTRFSEWWEANGHLFNQPEDAKAAARTVWLVAHSVGVRDGIGQMQAITEAVNGSPAKRDPVLGRTSAIKNFLRS